MGASVLKRDWFRFRMPEQTGLWRAILWTPSVASLSWPRIYVHNGDHEAIFVSYLVQARTQSSVQNSVCYWSSRPLAGHVLVEIGQNINLLTRVANNSFHRYLMSATVPLTGSNNCQTSTLGWNTKLKTIKIFLQRMLTAGFFKVMQRQDLQSIKQTGETAVF